MKALQFTAPGQITMLDDVTVPEPVEGEIQVKCTSVGMCGSNMGHYTGEGVWEKIMSYPAPAGSTGHENIGFITRSRHPAWKEGTLVLAQPEGHFGFAEYIVSRPPSIARLPQDDPDPCTLIIAQPLSTVLRALALTEESIINKTCAVIGQGSMGLIFTHILRLFGARKVFAVDILDWRLKWSKRYMADAVINASKDDPVAAINDLTGGEKCDFIVDAAGKESSLNTAVFCLRNYGRLLVFGMPHTELVRFPWYHVFRSNIQINTCVGPECGAYFQTAADMVVDNRASALRDIVTPRFPWDKAPEAFALYAANATDALKVTLEF
ncbi:MAG: zinc-binding dehydrogenase [Chitinispirillaceae bacterium]|nr:zinc-binding dehydrogenase [Chitinispirillaceae bacterium]